MACNAKQVPLPALHIQSVSRKRLGSKGLEDPWLGSVSRTHPSTVVLTCQYLPSQAVVSGFKAVYARGLHFILVHLSCRRHANAGFTQHPDNVRCSHSIRRVWCAEAPPSHTPSLMLPSAKPSSVLVRYGCTRCQAAEASRFRQADETPWSAEPVSPTHDGRMYDFDNRGWSAA